jgi:hypothetical protein
VACGVVSQHTDPDFPLVWVHVNIRPRTLCISGPLKNPKYKFQHTVQYVKSYVFLKYIWSSVEPPTLIAIQSSVGRGPLQCWSLRRIYIKTLVMMATQKASLHRCVAKNLVHKRYLVIVLHTSKTQSDVLSFAKLLRTAFSRKMKRLHCACTAFELYQKNYTQ